MDLKVLFHNPESLTNEELKLMRRKIDFQRSMPYNCAAFAGLSMYLIDNKMLRRYSDWKRIAVASVIGASIGAYDEDIVNAYDKKFLGTILNLSGYGSNYISGADFSSTQVYKKPY